MLNFMGVHRFIKFFVTWPLSGSDYFDAASTFFTQYNEQLCICQLHLLESDSSVPSWRLGQSAREKLLSPLLVVLEGHDISLLKC
jgi:hypothetical protein